MSKKILFLYFTPKQKAELIMCENAFRVIFRKFRKSALFSYMQIDTSLTCRDSFKEILFNEINKHDAVLINGGNSTGYEEEIFVKEILCLLVTENHINGKVICYPPSYYTAENENGDICEIGKTYSEGLRAAAELSLQLAKQRKHNLTVCTRAGCITDKNLFGEVQSLSTKALHIYPDHLSLDEMIFLCMKAIPSFDAVLSTESAARIIAMHLTSLAKAPTGYLLLHTKNGRAYLRQSFPHEEMSNAPIASLLMAFSAILENEFKMKNAAHWLRKSVATVFETHAYVPRDEFLNKVIMEAEKPMRNSKR